VLWAHRVMIRARVHLRLQYSNDVLATVNLPLLETVADQVRGIVVCV
jgi:hypothetical protein